VNQEFSKRFDPFKPVWAFKQLFDSKFNQEEITLESM